MYFAPLLKAYILELGVCVWSKKMKMMGYWVKKDI